MRVSRLSRMASVAMTLWMLQAVNAQTISRVSGNGQLVRTIGQNRTLEPLTVIVRNAAGTPLASWPITWVLDGAGLLTNCSEATSPVSYENGDPTRRVLDPGGKATCYFQAFSSIGGMPFTQSTVTANVLAGAGGAVVASTAFKVTSLGVDAQSGIVAQPSLIYPTDRAVVFTGRAGVQDTVPIQMYMSANGQWVPNVAVRLVPQTDPNTGHPYAATIACSGAEGIALTDDRGVANCYPVYGGTMGSGKFTIAMGGLGYQDSPDWNYTVTPGPPATMRVLQGGTQVGQPGQPLPTTLLARIEDAAGNALPNIPVAWQAIPSNAGTISNMSTASDSSGNVSARVMVGSIPGTNQIRVYTTNTTPAIEGFFTFTVSVVITGLQKVSGEPQEAVVGTQFQQPLIVQVNGANGPIPNIAVQFAVVRGDATVLTATATTDAQGRAQTYVRAGNQVGDVQVTATAGTASQTFALTQRLAGPSVTASSFWAHPFFAAGSANHGALAPGSVATISATGLAPGISGYVVPYEPWGPLPFQLGGVTVQFGSSWAPIYNVAKVNGVESVTLQVPFDITPGQVPVTVNVQNGGSKTVTIPILPTAPALFETVMSDGRVRVLAMRPDGSFVSLENKAQRGEIIKVYASGLGQGTMAVISSNQWGNNQDVGMPVAGIAGEGVRVVSARYSRNLIGVYEVEIEIPATAVSNDNATVNLITYNGDQRVDSNPSLLPIQ